MPVFKEQRYKLFESNSQLSGEAGRRLLRCFKEQRYKLFESNSQKEHKNSLKIKCHREHFQERDGLTVVDGGVFGTEP